MPSSWENRSYLDTDLKRLGEYVSFAFSPTPTSPSLGAAASAAVWQKLKSCIYRFYRIHTAAEAARSKQIRFSRVDDDNEMPAESMDVAEAQFRS